MFTDMVGYTALSQRDDKLALELLEEHRHLLREIFPRFHGTEIKTIGDAFLVEFNSALEAAQCAIEIQRALAKRNADATAQGQIELRIGVHIGDVVHRDGDVYGDGVNIASRIEPVANPGGICVSMDVERQIRSAVETRFEKLAPTELKNISVPMELFRIVLPWEKHSALSSPARARSESRSNNKRWITAAVIFLLIVAIGWWWTTRSGKNVTSATKQATSQPKSIPEKSIAVLPFDNLSDDKSNAYFAEGIQDEILTRLSKIGALKVISRTSTAKYKSAPDNLREVGKQLGVANLLEGSVQKIANAVHINVQLIRAATDEHVWAESYDRKLDDVFGVEGEVASAIADQLKATLSGSEKQQLVAKPTSNAEAYDAYLHGLALLERPDFDLRTAVESFETAVGLDANFALAWARLSYAHSGLFFGLDGSATRRNAARSTLDNALRLQPDLLETQLAEGYYHYLVERDYERARRLFEQIRARAPNNSEAPRVLAQIARRQGRLDESLARFHDAIELDPRNLRTLSLFSDTHIALRQFPAALKLVDRALDIAPENTDALVRKANIYQALGQLEQAGAVVAKIRIDPGDSGSYDVLAAQLLYQHRYAEGIAQLQSLLDKASASLAFDRARLLLWLGEFQRLSGDPAKARLSYLQTRSFLEAALRAQPDNAGLVSGLAVMDARLGERELAIKEAERSIELLPASKDALAGPALEQNRAIVLAVFGDKASAIAALQHLLTIPYLPNGTPITPALLRLDPIWDSLRGDPRFEKLCQEPVK